MTTELPSLGSTLQVTSHFNPTTRTSFYALLYTVTLHICLNFDSSRGAAYLFHVLVLTEFSKRASFTAMVLPTDPLVLTSWPSETCFGSVLPLLHQRREIIWKQCQHPPGSICPTCTSALQKQILNDCCKSPKFFSKCKHSFFF